LVRAHEAIGTVAAAGFPFLEVIDAARAAALLDIGPPDPEPGSLIDRFEVVRPLGRGAMGIVLLARDPRLDREVALKLLPAHLSLEAVANERLVAEARAASSLDHPQIATVHEIGEHTDGRIFIAMAYCPGGTLRDRLAAGPLPPEEALGVAAQLADGLAAAHAHGIVHRDVKPENIAFARDGGVRILDFGIATSATGAQAGSAGTVAYMSPEQTRGEATDPRTDVWAAGVVLFEMLSGRRPFEAVGRDALIEQIRMAEAPSPGMEGGSSEELRAVIRGCLANDPAKRFASGGELSAALHETMTVGARE